MRKIILLVCLVISTITVASPAFSSCLSNDEIGTLNNISIATNTSNTTLIAMQERLCLYNQSIYNISYNLSNITNITYILQNISYNMNNTIYNLSSNLSNITSYINNYTNTTSELIMNTTIKEVNISLKNVTDEMLEDFWESKGVSLQTQIDDLKISQSDLTVKILNTTINAGEFNRTVDDIKSNIITGDNQTSLQISQTIFPLWLAIIAIGAFTTWQLFIKQKYPKLGNIDNLKKLTGEKMSPHDLDSKDNDDLRAEMKTMRNFISEHEEFSQTTRAIVWQQYLDGDIDTTNDALKQMILTEPKKNPIKKVIDNDKKPKNISSSIPKRERGNQEIE